MSNEGWKTALRDLMPFVVASTMLETVKRLEWQQELTDHVATVFGVSILAVADGMVRALIGPDLEKKVGRPLTEWHWNVYWQEAMAKSFCSAWLNELDRICRQVADREIIRQFVWKGR